MRCVCLRKRPTLAPLVLAALAGALLWGRALLPDGTVAQDSGPQVIATIPLGPAEELQLTGDAAVDPERNLVYVVSNKTDAEKVFIIDGSTNTVTDTVVPGRYIWGMGVNSTTNRIYLSVGSSGGEGAGVQVIDGQTKAVLEHIEWIWGHVTVDPVANRIFTHDTSGYDDLLAIIDGVTHEVSTVEVGTSHYIETFIPEVNPQTGLVYVSYAGDDMVTVVDPTAKAVVTKIDIGAWPGHPVVNPETNRIYLQNRVDDETVVVDGSSHSVVARIPGDADAIAVNPETNRIYRAIATDIEVIDGTTNSVVSTLSWSDYWLDDVYRMAVNPQTGRVYIVGGYYADQRVVVVEDVATPSPSGPTPSPTSVSPAQGTMHNCPQPGKWAISVWEGPDGTDTGQALAACGAGAVAAAYYIDPETQGWSRWFAGRPQMTTLSTLDNMQGVIAFGEATAAAGAMRAVGSVRSAQGTEQMQNCPPAGRWSIAVWDGETGTAASDALASCGAGMVTAAYSLDPQTGAWSRWFAGKPDVSNLPPLNDLQGVLALGVATGPVVTPTPAATPTPASPPAPGTGDVSLVSSNAFTRTMGITIDGESREVTVVGELRNDSAADRSAGEITIRFYDGAGQQVGLRKTYAFDDIIRPGRTTALYESLPSLLYWSDETNDYPEGWTRYEIALSPHDPSEYDDRPVDITVENVQVSGDGLHVTGKAVNASSKTVAAYDASAYVVYRREDGSILNARQASALNQGPLAPGQSVPFDITFLSGEPVDFSSYVVQAYAEAE